MTYWLISFRFPRAGGPLNNAFFLEALLLKKVWFLRKQPKSMQEGDLLLFYGASLSFYAEALLANIEVASYGDRLALQELGIFRFKMRLLLDEVVFYKRIVPLRVLATSLELVSNKEYIGASVRLTPRAINEQDVLKIRLVTLCVK